MLNRTAVVNQPGLDRRFELEKEGRAWTLKWLTSSAAMDTKTTHPYKCSDSAEFLRSAKLKKCIADILDRIRPCVTQHVICKSHMLVTLDAVHVRSSTPTISRASDINTWLSNN